MNFACLTLLALLPALCFQPLFAQDPQTSAAVEISRDYLPASSMKQEGLSFDAYVASYLQDLVVKQFPESHVRIRVQNGMVILKDLPQNSDENAKIVAFVRETVSNNKADDATKTGMWFPESTILYPTQVANPLQVAFSGGVRLRDKVAGQVSTPVTFGDQLPLYRWNNVELWGTKGDMQLEIEGAVFAIFNQTHYSSPLVNADYYVAIPVSFATGPWAHRLRLYHISSHLGDEYMEHHKHIHRKNKSFEALDLFTSYNLTDQIRFYGGVGSVIHSDSDMHIKPLYIEYGLEVRVGRREYKELYGTPYLAMHFENWQDCDYKIDANFAVGYEWGKISGLGRKLRVALEYHNGYSCEGQFSKMRSDYIQARVSFGF